MYSARILYTSQSSVQFAKDYLNSRRIAPYKKQPTATTTAKCANNRNTKRRNERVQCIHIYVSSEPMCHTYIH